MQRLSQLSGSYRIEPVRAGLHCLWPSAAGARVPADRANIVKHDDFIADVVNRLNADAAS